MSETATISRAPQAPTGLLVPALAFVLLVAYSPLLNYGAWTTRAALLPLVGVLGLAVLPLRRREHGRSVALAGIGLILVATTSAALSEDRTVAFFGRYGWGTGALFVIALVGAWSLGHGLGRRRELLFGALAAGLLINLAVAMVSLFVDLEVVGLAVGGGRPTGLLGNPVNLAALSAGLVAYLVVRAEMRPAHLAVGFAAGGAVQLSGSRFALAICVVAVLVALVVRTPRKAVAALTCAVALGAAVIPLVAASSPGPVRTGTSRVAGEAPSQGVDVRVETWKMATDAVRRDPLLGSGPGTFAWATSRDRGLELGRIGPESLFADAHNLVVEYTVTTGFAGVAAMIAFVGLALTKARGPLLAFAGAVLLLHLVQPQSVAITPVGFLALGAASHTEFASSPRVFGSRGWVHMAVTGALLLAVAAGGALLYGDYQLRQSELDFTIEQAQAGNRVLPRWKETAALLARNYSYSAIVNRSDDDWQLALDWRHEATRRAPRDPDAWGRLADLEVRRGKVEEAAGHWQEALRWNPQSVSLRLGLGQTLALLGRPEQALPVYRAALLRSRSPQVRQDIMTLIRSAERGERLTPDDRTSIGATSATSGATGDRP